MIYYVGKKRQKGKASGSKMQKPEKTGYSDSYGFKDCIQSKLMTTAALHKHPLENQPVYSGWYTVRKRPQPPICFLLRASRRVSCHFTPPVHQQPGKTVDAAVSYSILAAYLQPHITGMSLKLFAKVLPG